MCHHQGTQQNSLFHRGDENYITVAVSQYVVQKESYCYCK